MFDAKYPLWLRGISLFHLALPPTLIWMLHEFGYDPRAYPAQLVLTIVVLVFCYAFTDPEKNINWVYGPGEKPQRKISPRLYFAILVPVITLGVVTPMHFLLSWLFGAAGVLR
jgi:hypothetical protein